jgi:hypothetical protein
LFGLAFAFAAGGLVTYWVAVRTALGQRVDDAALIGRSAVPGDLVEDAWTILDTMGMASLGAASLAVVAVALVRRRPSLAWAAGVVLLGSNLTTQALKHAVLTRPELGVDGVLKPFNTLPSGHATVAISVAVALVIVVPPRHRAVTAVLGSLFATAVGIAVVTAGWHRPSDSVAAWFVVGFWAAAALAVVTAGGRAGEAATGSSVAEVTLWLAAAGLLAGAALLGVGWVGMRAGLDWLGADAGVGARRALVHGAAAAAVAGTALTVMSMLVAPLRRLDA